jgi:CBS domain-containing protein
MAVVGSLMKTDIVTVRSTDKIADVARRMSDRAVGAALIVDGEKLVGIFSERDLLTRVVAPGLAPDTAVSEVATRDVVTVEASTHVRECAKLLKEKGCRHLPVMRGGKLAGIISARDFFAQMTGALERFIDERNYKAELEAGVDPYDHLGGAYTDVP